MSQFFVSPPHPLLPIAENILLRAVCYTPEFQSTKNSDQANKSYITMIKRYSTSLLGKVGNRCISRNQERQARLGYRSSKRRMRSCMATTRICWEVWNVMRLRTSLGKSWFFVSCQENSRTHPHHFSIQRCFDRFAKQGMFYILY